MEERAAIVSQMTTDQVAEGQRLASEWKPGLALGKSRVKTAAIAQPEVVLAQSLTEAGGDLFPARPPKQQGATTCNTNCVNGACYRTYSDGRKVEFQAQRKWNPLANAFEWASDTC